MDSLAAGTLLTARAVGMITVAGLAALVLRRIGNRPPMLVGFAASAAGPMLLALSPHRLGSYGWLAMSAALAARSANPGIAESDAFLGLGLLLLRVAPLILRVPARNAVHRESVLSEG